MGIAGEGYFFFFFSLNNNRPLLTFVFRQDSGNNFEQLDFLRVLSKKAHRVRADIFKEDGYERPAKFFL